jgi:hypothetical protein
LSKHADEHGVAKALAWLGMAEGLLVARPHARAEIDIAIVHAGAAAREMKDERAREQLMPHIVKAHARRGNVRDALRTVAGMISPAARAVGIGAIADGLPTQVPPLKARAVLAFGRRLREDLRDLDRTHDGLLQAIALVRAKAARYRAAVAAAQEIQDRQQRAEALARIACELVDQGAHDSAREVTVAALAAARMTPSGDPRSYALAAVAVAEIRVGDLTAASEAVEAITSEHCLPQLLAGIAFEEAKAGRKDLAQGTFATALSRARALSYEPSKRIVEAVVAVSQAQAGFGAEALDTAARAGGQVRWVYGDFARAFAEQGDQQLFKRILVPCGYFEQAAYLACGLLAGLYPEQVEALRRVLLNET